MKKGFTLVELLAVIAILAILVIIALPNVMGMFNTAKENSFRTEVKEIYKTAQQQWIQDSMYNTGEQVYTRCKTCSGKSLNLSGRSELEYYIRLNKSGDVVEYKVTDGTFQYSYQNESTPLKIESIDTIQKIAEITNASDKVTITSPLNGEIYIAYDGQMKIGEPVPSNVTYYNSYEALREVSTRPVFIKHIVTNNIVTESYVGFIINDNNYYVRGGITSVGETERKNQMDNIFSSCSLNMTGDNYHCSTNKIKGSLYGDSFGGITVDDVSSGCYVGCHIDSTGTSLCSSEQIIC